MPLALLLRDDFFDSATTPDEGCASAITLETCKLETRTTAANKTHLCPTARQGPTSHKFQPIAPKRAYTYAHPLAHPTPKAGNQQQRKEKREKERKEKEKTIKRRKKNGLMITG
jgi:hypothetical protein